MIYTQQLLCFWHHHATNRNVLTVHSSEKLIRRDESLNSDTPPLSIQWKRKAALCRNLAARVAACLHRSRQNKWEADFV